MYVVYTFGGLSVSVRPKVPQYVFMTLRGSTEGFLNYTAFYMFVLRSTRAFHQLVHAQMGIIVGSGTLCGFSRGASSGISSKQSRSALPNSKSIRTNQIQNLGGDQGAGQTVILNSLSVSQGSIA